LKAYEDRTRNRARIELRLHNSDEVVAKLAEWIENLDETEPDHEHHLLEALWVHQHHNRVNRQLLERVLTSPNAHARAAATRVVCYWRDQLDDPLSLLAKSAVDEHPRVRLEAVRACSFFKDD